MIDMDKIKLSYEDIINVKVKIYCKSCTVLYKDYNAFIMHNHIRVRDKEARYVKTEVGISDKPLTNCQCAISWCIRRVSPSMFTVVNGIAVPLCQDHYFQIKEQRPSLDIRELLVNLRDLDSD